VTERAEGAEPFPVIADPRNYVQTAASEDALAALQRKVREGRGPVALVGTPGVGKTLLLRVLERRLAASFHVVYLPFALLPADELYAWALGLLGESAGPDPERDLLAASLRLEGTGSGLVVMLDDAGSMPVATARRLSALFAEAEGALRLVLALAEGSRSDQMLSAFQPAVSRVELRALSSSEETARYLRAHLVRSNAPQEVRARFDPASILDLHRGSGGVPRVLSGLAGELARGNLAVLPRHERVGHGEPFQSGAAPFAVTSDPAAYVPRRATQELVESVEDALRSGAQVIAVTGPAGLGKTLLLRVLERRLRGGSRTVRISYTALFPDELCRWILTLVGEPAAEDPEAALLELAQHLGSSQRNLVLLLDDASSSPVPTVRRLVELASETNGAMRLVLFAVEDVRTAGILAALGSDAVTLRFTEPMSEDETAEYIYARLARARAPTALVEYFDPETVARLHVESEGIPRELHKLASECYREGERLAATRAPTPDLPETRVPSEPQAQPTPPVPSRAGVEKPKRGLVRERAPTSERAIVFGLLAIAILLAAIPLLRGGLPWMAARRSGEPAVAPPAAVQPPGTLAPPTPEESVEPIAVNVSAMPWASIEVDGKYLGVTPLEGVPLSPGQHLFRARMPDGEIREHRVEVGPTMRHVVFYADRKRQQSVREPKQAAEPAPPPPIPGELPEIAVDAIPYLERELPEIAVAPEQVASVREPEPAAPPPAPEPISVSINATPWATIEIDGDEVGITPVAGVLLAPGDHQFRVVMPDGTVLERIVRIAPDNRHIAFGE
jgi:type II secretory pathway predicted ATPase ExeA